MSSKKVYYALISGMTALALLEILTGLALYPLYRPEAASAFTSSKAIEGSALWGVVQSFHHWASALLIVTGGGAILFGLVSGQYRETSRKLWCVLVVLVALFMGLQLTGHILPWDQHAVRTATVEAGVAQGAPIVGNLQGQIMRGGATVGPQTLNLWFFAHVLLFSVLLLGSIVFLYRKLNSDGTSKKQWLLGGGVLTALALILALAMRPKLGLPATDADYLNYNAKPEWYILPMHVLLGYASGIRPSVGFLGSMGVPGLAGALVLVAPWIGRREKKPIFGIALGTCLLLLVVGTSATDLSETAAPAGPNVYNDGPKPGQATPAAQLDPALVSQGQKMFSKQGCANCHTVAGKGGNAGPVLDGTGTRHPDLNWQVSHLSNPKSEVPTSTMPAFAYLGAASVKAIAEYLETLK